MKKALRIALLILLAAVFIASPVLIIRYIPRTPVPADQAAPKSITVARYEVDRVTATAAITDPERLEWVTDAFRGDRFRYSNSSGGPRWGYELTFVYGSEEKNITFLLSEYGIQLGSAYYRQVDGKNYSELCDYLKSLT